MTIRLNDLPDSVIVSLANANDYEGARAIMQAVQTEHDKIAQRVLYNSKLSAEERDKLATKTAILKEVLDLPNAARELKQELSAKQQNIRSTE